MKRQRLISFLLTAALILAALPVASARSGILPATQTKNTQVAFASSARTSSANSSSFPVGDADQLIGFLSVTATIGGTLDVNFQDSPDGGTTWFDITGGAFSQVSSGSSSQTIQTTRIFGRNVRVKTTISGGGGFTFSVHFIAYKGTPTVVASSDLNASNLGSGTLPLARLANIAASNMAENVVRTTSVNLAAADIIAMGTTPVSLIAAPGAGKIILVESITFKMTRTSTAFTGGGALEFRYTDASGAKVSADIAATVVTTGGAGTEYNHVGGVVSSLTPVANAAVVIRNATAAFADGTGTAVVTIKYRIVTP